MPIHKFRYLSILKEKEGELLAVERLNPSVWGMWNPLIEVLPPAPKQEKPSTNPDRKPRKVKSPGKDLADACRADHTVFLDFEKIATDPDRAQQILIEIEAEGATAVPVVNSASPTRIRSLARGCAQLNGGSCVVRVAYPELSSNVKEWVPELLAESGAKAEQSFLIVDLGELPAGHVRNIAVTLPDLLKRFPALKKWASVTLAATGIPHILDIPPATAERIPRTEWTLFNLVSKDVGALVRRLDFGDYAITNPRLVDFKKHMQVSPKILYTTDSDWIVLKGKSAKRHTWEQTRGMCKNLVGLTEFLGADFSYGDHYITACADGESIATGQGGVWKKVGTNHHITLVARQVASLPGP